MSSSGAPTTTTTNSTSNNNTSNSTSGGSAGKNNSTSEAHIPPLLGVAPLGPAQLTVEHELQFKMLQAAFFHMPHPSDSERLRLHLPRQPCQTPLYYPQVGHPSTSSNPSVMSVLGMLGNIRLQDCHFFYRMFAFLSIPYTIVFSVQGAKAEVFNSALITNILQ